MFFNFRGQVRKEAVTRMRKRLARFKNRAAASERGRVPWAVRGRSTAARGRGPIGMWPSTHKHIRLFFITIF